ncbi:MAG TPA: hypothetical protein VMM35_12315 [Longimicrobiales bacterium]|nr:hypothetical protein [Longimicrobiales bacterium]
MTARGDASSGGALLTLEPLIEAVRAGVEGAGWALSGLQKTTSHQFEGRWQGESTRSAYLFFHSERAPEEASLDVYLDETTQGLAGNLALVVDLAPLAELGDPAEALRVFGALTSTCLPPDHATPLTLRLRLEGEADPATAETEVRFKVRIPRRAVGAGAEAVRRLAASAVGGFERILASAELARFTIGG